MGVWREGGRGGVRIRGRLGGVVGVDREEIG